MVSGFWTMTFSSSLTYKIEYRSISVSLGINKEFAATLSRIEFPFLFSVSLVFKAGGVVHEILGNTILVNGAYKLD